MSKSKAISDQLKSGEFLLGFEKTSDNFPGTWIIVGDESPVKNKEQLKVNISRKITHGFAEIIYQGELLHGIGF